MATFKVVRDPRYKRKNGSMRYCLRYQADGYKGYHQIEMELTNEQHRIVFEQKSMSQDAIDYREKVRQLETKAERIYSKMRSFDPVRFKALYDKKEEAKENESDLPKTLAIKEMFSYFLKNKPAKVNTVIHKKSTLGVLEKYHPNLYLDDVTVNFLNQFEKDLAKKGKSRATVSSYIRDLRTVINYFRTSTRIIPMDYEYPFGKGGYSVKAFRRKKAVLTNEEILQVIEYDDFDSHKQEYARNIWLVLYYGSGINPIDLLKLRWDNIEGNQIKFIRTKTETTRQTELQELSIPLTDDLRYYLNKVAIPKEMSAFIIGKLKDGYSETTLLNRKNRFRQEINPELKKIEEKLGLGALLRMSTARSCYASTLKRKGVSRDSIGEMLGHRDPRTTMAYLDSLSGDEAFRINNGLVSIGRKEEADFKVD